MPKTVLALEPPASIRVLLVEDNESDAYVVSGLLVDHSKANYSLHHVQSQADALAALAESEFDVCLLDLTLPDAHDFSALIDIQGRTPDMPVLILTGHNDMAMAKRAVAQGAQDYLLKDELAFAALSRSIDYAMERKKLGKGLLLRANHDALTGLPNREMFLERLKVALARAERSAIGLAVLFIDLDSFKPVNDTHGHNAGDEILKTVAQRINAILRIYDTPARIGGDEFAILLEGIVSPSDAGTIAQKIINALSAPIDYQGKRLVIGASAGIVLSGGQVAPEELLRQADTAMYQAKNDDKGTYRFYTVQGQSPTRIRLENGLREAIEKNELRLYYQPYTSSDGVTVLGVEALLRWNHPEHGQLCAGEFLPAAEDAKLMPHIAEWMCSQLAIDITLWNASAIPPLCIAFNLSGSQLASAGLLKWLAPIAGKDFLGSHRLAAEISEGVVASSLQSCFPVLDKLGAMGIGLHLDNFGGGYLSLTMLHSLPFSMLKLNAELVRNMSSGIAGNVLIRTAILLAHQLGMKVSAVGVEVPWQLYTLREQSCDIVQGFLTVQPMKAEHLGAWMAHAQNNAGIRTAI